MNEISSDVYIDFKNEPIDFFRLQYSNILEPVGITGNFVSVGTDCSKKQNHYFNFIFDMKDKFLMRESRILTNTGIISGEIS